MGLAVGDAFCAGREGGPLERLLWRVIGRCDGRHRYTDDTQMALDLARHLIAHRSIIPDTLATDFARSYQWSRGYGPSTTHVLKQIRKGMPWHVANVSRYPHGSFGNGAAMRIPVIAMAYLKKPQEMDAAVVASSSVTHPHPSAITGARLVCTAVAAGLNRSTTNETMAELMRLASGSDHETKMRLICDLIAQSTTPPAASLRRSLGTGTAAVDSCPTAILLGLRFRDCDIAELIAYVNMCSGDTDTIAAMAGAIWGAANGIERIPNPMRRNIEGDDTILQVAIDLHALAISSS
jgi:poly(ADP-ribose) glycohydrolase ARH3